MQSHGKILTYQCCEVHARIEVYKALNDEKFTLDGRKFQIFITRLSFLGVRIYASTARNCLQLFMRELKSTRALTLCINREYQQHQATADDDLHRLPIKSHTSSADSTKDNQTCYILSSSSSSLFAHKTPLKHAR